MAITYEPIATTTITGSAASVTFSSISGSYTDLVLIASCRGSVSDPLSILRLRFNSDTGSNYSTTQLYGNGSTASSNRVSNQTSIGLEYAIGNTGTANTFTPIICNFNNYSNTTTYKTIVSRTNHAGERVGAQVSLWRSTSAINSIEIVEVLGTTWAVGSTFTLYGIASA